MPIRTEHTLPLELLQEIVLDSGRDLPLHAQLRSSLERFIRERCEDGTRFYSEAQLIKNLRVSQGTVRRALADLAAAGLLKKLPARGTVVTKGEAKEKGLRNLAVFLPDFSSSNIANILSLLNEQCLNRNMRLQPIYTHRGERLLKAYNMLQFGAEEGGVVLLENSPQATVELAAALEDKGYNCVHLGTLLRHSHYKYVGTSEEATMTVALEHLAGLGHRNIAFLVNEPEEKETVRECVAAVEEWARRNPALTVRVWHGLTRVWEDSKEAVWRALPEARAAGATAILAVSDIGALYALQWLQRQGVRVPEEMSVIGSDGIELGALYHPALTTVAHPRREMVAAVFELLEEWHGKPRKIFLQPALVVRESTAPPPA